MRITMMAAVFLAVLGVSAASDVEAAVRRSTSISAQGLGPALETLAKERNFQILYVSSVVDGLHTNGAAGELTDAEALTKLLNGTGLTFKYLDEKTVTVVGRATAANRIEVDIPRSGGPSNNNAVEGSKDLQLVHNENQSAQQSDSTSGQSPEERKNPESPLKDSKNEDLEEIVVTGTHIRGSAPIGAPLTVYSREDIERSGVGTVDQFARTMPQNFSSIDASALVGSSASGFNQRGQNITRGAGFNLYGLGPGATLTLLNGHRLTPGGGDGDFVDISLIPLSAVERIEVLSGGASAIYGADAIAGVVNLILRNDFEGAETSLRYSDTTQGGKEEITASQLFGTSWDSGSAMLVYEYLNQDELFAAKRDFTDPTFAPVTIEPDQDRNSVFARLRQDIRDGTTFSGEAYYSKRDSVYSSALIFAPPPVPAFLSGGDSSAMQYGGTLELSQRLAAQWQATLVGGLSEIEQRDTSFIPAFAQLQVLNIDTTLVSADLRADGPLFSLPAGMARLAVGAGHRTEKFTRDDFFDVGGVPIDSPPQRLDRQVGSVYAEILLPLIGEANPGFATRRLDLSLAARYDDYDDVGSSSNPKVSLLWSPLSGLDLKASYATSFRPPLLVKLEESGQPFYFVLLANDPASPGDQIATLVRQDAGNTGLRPEESESWTLGFDLRPQRLSGLTVGVSYFHTEFSDRVEFPPVIGGQETIFSQLDVLAPFIDSNPDPQAIAEIFNDPSNFVLDPANVGAAGIEATFDFRPANIAETRESGVEMSASYTRSGSYGTLDFSLSGTYLFEVDYEPARGAASASLLNIVGEPVDLRLNGSVGWSRNGFGTALTLRYWDSYKNTFFSPLQDVDSWLTADLQLSYRVEGDAPPGILNGLSIALTVLNLADSDPPEVPFPVGSIPQIGFDTANASPLGRSVSLALTKRW